MEPTQPDLNTELRDRLSTLERDVRDLHMAMERSTTAIETLTAEVRELRRWIETTSESTKAIAESRIWRSLTAMARLLGVLSRPTPPARLPPKALERDPDAEYQRWIAAFESCRTTTEHQDLQFRPTISFVAAELPPRTLESILRQTYADWEVCLPELAPVLSDFRDSRIRISASSVDPTWSSLLRFATGEYVAAIAPGGVLSSAAVESVVESLQGQPRPDILYSDEDVMDDAGKRSRVFFKPGWSPDLLLSMNYVGGLFFFRRQLAIEAGDLYASISLRSAYELLLDLCERATRVERIPKVLWHTPPRPLSGLETDRRAVDQHLSRSRPGAWTEPDPAGERWRVRYPDPVDRHVSVIIPSRGNTALLEAILQDLAVRTEYPEMEILVVDNSAGVTVEGLVRDGGWGKPLVRNLDWRRKAFNFATICNAGAKRCKSPFLLFLNDDMRVLAPGWLQALVEVGARREVGAVGARLLFPDGSIQHAGIALGLYERTGHLFKGLDGRKRHYFGLDRAIRDVSAVTGACLLVRRQVFCEVGGFDERHYPVDFNDIDLCLRIRAAGYRVIYTPYAELCHYESVSKQSVHRLPSHSELEQFRATWATEIADDPFYNPNLTRSEIDCSPRTEQEW